MEIDVGPVQKLFRNLLLRKVAEVLGLQGAIATEVPVAKGVFYVDPKVLDVIRTLVDQGKISRQFGGRLPAKKYILDTIEKEYGRRPVPSDKGLYGFEDD